MASDGTPYRFDPPDAFEAGCARTKAHRPQIWRVLVKKGFAVR